MPARANFSTSTLWPMAPSCEPEFCDHAWGIDSSMCEWIARTLSPDAHHYCRLVWDGGGSRTRRRTRHTEMSQDPTVPRSRGPVDGSSLSSAVSLSLSELPPPFFREWRHERARTAGTRYATRTPPPPPADAEPTQDAAPSGARRRGPGASTLRARCEIAWSPTLSPTRRRAPLGERAERVGRITGGVDKRRESAAAFCV